MAELRQYLIDKLYQSEVKLNIPQGAAAPHILNIALPNIKSETMLHYLSGKGIYVSSGSACSSRSLKPSSSLVAFGLSPKEADCSIRISLSEFNSKNEADELIVALNSGISTLVRQK
jgi:cysteine desulfurase